MRNHLKSAAAALIRNGRIDRRFDLGFATASQIERLFERFFPLEERASAQAFRHAFEGRPVSMAALQEFLLERRDDPASAVSDARNLVSDHSLEIVELV